MSRRTSDCMYNTIRMQVVTSSEQLMHALAVRAICFMEDTGLSAGQTFDGNDFQATHILVYAGDEPIGTTRLRWFSGFAKIERTAFRQAYRSARILKLCSDFIFDHVAQKGYNRLVAHAPPHYARVWQRVLGFEPVPGRCAIPVAGLEPHIEIVKHLIPPGDAITANSDPIVLSRIEGAWRTPSSMESLEVGR